MSDAPVLGILGGGQLAQMMARAARPLGISCIAIDPNPDACAASDAELWVNAYDDTAALQRLADRADAVTFEFENVPASSLEILAEKVRIAPSAEALRVSSDRIVEKRFFDSTGVAIGPYREVSSADELRAAVRELGLPAVVKSCSGGYDGKGQRVLRTEADAQAAADWIETTRCIYESFVSFDRELSIVACRSGDGDFVTYPLAENTHEQGMLVRSIAPADVTDETETQARRAARKIAERLGYVGVFAIEFFDVGGRLLANEMAPRVHNTGHWTIEGAGASQFENHVRAVMGLGLGPTRAIGHSEMLNIIGKRPGAGVLEGIEGAHLHDYAKAERRGRKIGHITVTDPDAGRCREKAEVIRGRLRNELPVD